MCGHPHYTKDKELLERVQHRFSRMIKEARDKDYIDRLKELNLWTLEERRNRADLMSVLRCTKGSHLFTLSLYSLYTVFQKKTSPFLVLRKVG